MKRIRIGHKQERGRQRCRCTGEGPTKERAHCHLCKTKYLAVGFREIGGHMYCPVCLNLNTI